MIRAGTWTRQAAQVRARYARRLRRAPLARILRRLRPSAGARLVPMRPMFVHNVSIPVRVQLSNQAAPGANRPLYRPVHRTVRSILRVSAMTPVTRLLVPARDVATRVRTVEVFRTAPPIERKAAATIAVPRGSLGASRAAPPRGSTRVVRYSAAPPVERVPRPVSSGTSDVAPTPEGARPVPAEPIAGLLRRAASSPTGGAVPPIDVRTLTNQVVRAIDARITAQRERIGGK